jgi:hypothetical protein
MYLLFMNFNFYYFVYTVSSNFNLDKKIMSFKDQHQDDDHFSPSYVWDYEFSLNQIKGEQPQAPNGNSENDT